MEPSLVRTPLPSSGSSLGLVVGFGILVSLFPFHSWAAPAYACRSDPDRDDARRCAEEVRPLRAAPAGRSSPPPGLSGVGHESPAFPAAPRKHPLGGPGHALPSARWTTMLANSSVMHMGYMCSSASPASTSSGREWCGASHVCPRTFHCAAFRALREAAGRRRDRALRPDWVAWERWRPASRSPSGWGLSPRSGCRASPTSPVRSWSSSGASRTLGARSGGCRSRPCIAAWGVVISAVYALRAYRNIFQGEVSAASDSRVITKGWRFPSYLLIAALLIIGCFPNLFLNLLPSTDSAVPVPRLLLLRQATTTATTTTTTVTNPSFFLSFFLSFPQASQPCLPTFSNSSLSDLD